MAAFFAFHASKFEDSSARAGAHARLAKTHTAQKVAFISLVAYGQCGAEEIPGSADEAGSTASGPMAMADAADRSEAQCYSERIDAAAAIVSTLQRRMPTSVAPRPPGSSACGGGIEWPSL